MEKRSFLAACGLPPQPLFVPEIDRQIHLRYLSAREASELRALAKSDPAIFAGSVAVRVVCDEHGDRMFEPEDASAVADLPNIVLERIVSRALAMNALATDAEEQVEAELEGQAENPTASP